MARTLARIVLTLVLLASGAMTLHAGWKIWTDPTLRPLRDATTAEIAASLDTALTREATPDRLAARIEQRLAEVPRNWVALDGLTGLAASRAITLDTALLDRLATARDEDFGLLSLAEGCAACMIDVSTCTLNTGLVCKLPILLTPIEDLRGVGKASLDYLVGGPVDQIDLGLSVIGLAATGLSLASGGSALSVKAGTSVARLARGMNLLSPRLVEMSATAMRTGIDWAGIPGLRGADGASALLRADALAPLTETLTEIGRGADLLGVPAMLHLLPLVDDAADARHIAQVATAAGENTIGAAELLGKSRLFRLTLRGTDLALTLALGLGGLLAGLVSVLSSAAFSISLRFLRRSLR